MTDRKSINLSQEEDVERWKDIKMKEMNERNDPDLDDIEILREMMENWEDGDPQ